MRAPQECSCSMDLTTSLAEPRGGGRDDLGTCWVELSVNTTVRPAGVKPFTGHRVLRAKAHETVAACHSLCPALRRSKAPYAARAGSPGHQQDHHHIASASPCLLPRTPRLNFLWQTRKVNLAARRHSESKDCPQLNHWLRASFSQQNFHPLRSHHVMPLLTKAFSLNTGHLQSSVNHPS